MAWLTVCTLSSVHAYVCGCMCVATNYVIEPATCFAPSHSFVPSLHAFFLLSAPLVALSEQDCELLEKDAEPPVDLLDNYNGEEQEELEDDGGTRVIHFQAKGTEKWVKS